MNGSKNNSKKRLDKKIIILVIVLVLFIIGAFLGVHYYNNYKEYSKLNYVMSDLKLGAYEENNYTVRDKTLYNMEQEIHGGMTEYVKKYNEEFSENPNIEKDIEEIVNSSTIAPPDKYTGVKNVVEEDLAVKVSDKEEELLDRVDELEEIADSLEDIPEEEIEKYDSMVEEYNNLAGDESLDALYSDYATLDNIEGEIAELEADIKIIEKEEKAAKKAEKKEEKAKEEEEEDAKDEADSQDDNTDSLETSTSTDLPNDGNYNRSIGQALFNSVNAYRSSIGLPPYAYNSSMQACVDSESQAYAVTQNPHNWLCSVSNENASLAPIGSDAVKISMDFFTTDPPHEAVLSGNYTSATTSIYESNGMYYMILCVF